MRLPTYGRVWRVERRLYKILDLQLPAPVAPLQAVAFVVAAVVVLLAGHVVGVPLNAWTFLPHLGVAGFAAWLAAQPVGDRKRPHEWVRSRISHRLEPRALVDFADAHEPRELRLVLSVLERNP